MFNSIIAPWRNARATKPVRAATLHACLPRAWRREAAFPPRGAGKRSSNFLPL